MCTISILALEHGELSLMMNRDESPLRPAALDLKRGHSDSGLEFAYPLDPKSQGSWVGVNARGVTLAVMNQHPQGYFKPSGLRSRGELVPRFIDALNAGELKNRFERLDASPYPPFFMLALDRQSPFFALRWDGSDKEILAYPRANRVFGSSSFNTEEVLLGRQQQFDGLLHEVDSAVEADKAVALQEAFHASHSPARGPYSICMHRDDAQSVSLTEIRLKALNIQLKYHAGPPCVAAAEQSVNF